MSKRVLTKKQAIDLFLELNFEEAKDWDAQTLDRRTRQLNKAVDKNFLKEIEGTVSEAAFTILENITQGYKYMVGEDVVPGEEATIDEGSITDNEQAELQARSKEVADRELAEEEATDKEVAEDKPAKKKKANGKPGILNTIVATLKEKGPVTKAEILEELCEKFPDRNRKSMKNTVGVAVPSGLKSSKKIIVKKTEDKKYYIAQ